MQKSPFERDWSGDTEWLAHHELCPADLEFLERHMDMADVDPEITKLARERLEQFFRRHPKELTA